MTLSVIPEPSSLIDVNANRSFVTEIAEENHTNLNDEIKSNEHYLNSQEALKDDKKGDDEEDGEEDREVLQTADLKVMNEDSEDLKFDLSILGSKNFKKF